MDSKEIVVNCPFCLADIEASQFAGTVQCPFCDKKFNLQDAKITRELLMQKKLAEEDPNKNALNQNRSNTGFGVGKYCTECGRKLAADARYCDWCGEKLKY